MTQGFLIFEASRSQTITLGRNPLEELTARRRDIYLTTHNTHMRHPCPSGIQTHNPIKRIAADPGLGPHGRWDRCWLLVYIKHYLSGANVCDYILLQRREKF
jgi:hypothetical protein